MGNIISTELLKIKRYSVVKAGLVMMLSLIHISEPTRPY